MADRRWRVLRQDDNGNVFVASRPLSETEARARVAAFEARAHKQLYFVEAVDPADRGEGGDRLLVGARINE